MKLTPAPYRQLIQVQRLVGASFLVGHSISKRKLASRTYTEAVEEQKICSKLN